MVTHVVLIKLKDRSPEGVSTTAAVLESMRGRVPALGDLELGVDRGGDPRAYDIALVTRFASWDDLEAYRVDPHHKGVVLPHLAAAVESSVVVDYEAPA
jgi:hypothetical protein